MSKCNPHRWDYENWLLLFEDARPADYPAMTCTRCSRELAIRDTSQNVRVSIANSLAFRLFDGDEFDEVYAAVHDYFRHHLATGPSISPLPDFQPLPERKRRVSPSALKTGMSPVATTTNATSTPPPWHNQKRRRG